MRKLPTLSSLAKSIRFRMIVHWLPDRVYFRKSILPEIRRAGPSDVLLVGTRRYTASHPRMLSSPSMRVWTVDLDVDAARWGNGSWHRVGDVCQLKSLFGSTRFDVILANGILGFGIDDADSTQQMMRSVAEVLNPGGYLMLGWDADRTADPYERSEITSYFEPAPFGSLPARYRVDGMNGFDHVFDWMVARRNECFVNS